mmetsp:Transcript_32348/g.40085  ORF Transcript_32348/g.40085 Transcript_32348/m.40085 type:complete len:81 (+) Transcript_32348:336-578(+)
MGREARKKKLQKVKAQTNTEANNSPTAQNQLSLETKRRKSIKEESGSINDADMYDSGGDAELEAGEFYGDTMVASIAEVE